jgi:molecular chaperone GrpE
MNKTKANDLPNQKDEEKNLEKQQQQQEEASKAQKQAKLAAQIEQLIQKPELKELLSKLNKKIDAFDLEQIIESEKELLDDLAETTKQRDEYLRLLQQYKADFENYKKRIEKRNKSNIQFYTEKIIKRIFEPIEDLSRVIEFAEERQQEEIPLEGITLIHQKLERILDDENVEVIRPKPGDTFNPRYHEAVCVDPTGKYEAGKVSRLLEKGYCINNRVVEAAKVMVAEEQQKTSKSDEK